MPTPEQTQQIAEIREAIASQLRAQYNSDQDAPVPPRLATLVRELQAREDATRGIGARTRVRGTRA